MRETGNQRGYLVLADLSGFTSFLAQAEHDHAHKILTELLETIAAKFRTLLTISKFEGDAVFAFAPEERIPRGETLLELIESTYLAFRDRLESSHKRTNCTCKACGKMTSLDLKFFVHFGNYNLQSVSGSQELLGSDVNLLHRLLKNGVAGATGWRAYALLTDACIARLGVRPEELHETTESYEHLGEVRACALDLHPRHSALIDARRVVVTEKESHVISRNTYPVPAPALWDWLNDPEKRALWAPDPSKFIPVNFPGGRSGIGAQTQCIHGKGSRVIETVLDWRPFEYFTVEQKFGSARVVGTFRLTPEGDRTSLEVFERGRVTSLGFVDLLIMKCISAFVHSTQRALDILALRLKDAAAK